MEATLSRPTRNHSTSIPASPPSYLDALDTAPRPPTHDVSSREADDSDRLVQQFVRMGISESWARIALRRCAGNVDDAIKFCIECGALEESSKPSSTVGSNHRQQLHKKKKKSGVLSRTLGSLRRSSGKHSASEDVVPSPASGGSRSLVDFDEEQKRDPSLLEDTDPPPPDYDIVASASTLPNSSACTSPAASYDVNQVTEADSCSSLASASKLSENGIRSSDVHTQEEEELPTYEQSHYDRTVELYNPELARNGVQAAIANGEQIIGTVDISGSQSPSTTGLTEVTTVDSSALVIGINEQSVQSVSSTSEDYSEQGSGAEKGESDPTVEYRASHVSVLSEENIHLTCLTNDDGEAYVAQNIAAVAPPQSSVQNETHGVGDTYSYEGIAGMFLRPSIVDNISGESVASPSTSGQLPGSPVIGDSNTTESADICSYEGIAGMFLRPSIVDDISGESVAPPSTKSPIIGDSNTAESADICSYEGIAGMYLRHSIVDDISGESVAPPSTKSPIIGDSNTAESADICSYEGITGMFLRPSIVDDISGEAVASSSTSGQLPGSPIIAESNAAVAADIWSADGIAGAFTSPASVVSTISPSSSAANVVPVTSPSSSGQLPGSPIIAESNTTVAADIWSADDIAGAFTPPASAVSTISQTSSAAVDMRNSDGFAGASSHQSNGVPRFSSLQTTESQRLRYSPQSSTLGPTSEDAESAVVSSSNAVSATAGELSDTSASREERITPVRESVQERLPTLPRMPLQRPTSISRLPRASAVQEDTMDDDTVHGEAYMAVSVDPGISTVTDIYMRDETGGLYVAVAAPLTAVDNSEQTDVHDSPQVEATDPREANRRRSVWARLYGEEQASWRSRNGERGVKRRVFLPFNIVEHEGKFQPIVTLRQPKLGVNDGPQHNRPSTLPLSASNTRELAMRHAEVNTPPMWAGGNDPKECVICLHSAGLFYKIHHCRNCGYYVCNKCSRKDWPATMLPRTYVPYKENVVRVCDSCAYLQEGFVDALRSGNVTVAMAFFSTGNVNLHCPMTIYKSEEYPLHSAVQGGNIYLVRWLLEERKCSLRGPDGEPLRTTEGLTPFALAAYYGHADIMEYLVRSHGCKVIEIKDSSVMARGLHAALRAPGDLPATTARSSFFRGRRAVPSELEQVEAPPERDSAPSNMRPVPAQLATGNRNMSHIPSTIAAHVSTPSLREPTYRPKLAQGKRRTINPNALHISRMSVEQSCQELRSSDAPLTSEILQEARQSRTSNAEDTESTRISHTITQPYTDDDVIPVTADMSSRYREFASPLRESEAAADTIDQRIPVTRTLAHDMTGERETRGGNRINRVASPVEDDDVSVDTSIASYYETESVNTIERANQRNFIREQTLARIESDEREVQDVLSRANSGRLPRNVRRR